MNSQDWLIGDWAGSEKVFPTAWGPERHCENNIEAAYEAGGAVLVVRHRSDWESQPWFRAHLVITQPKQGNSRAFWFDNFSFVPTGGGVEVAIDFGLLQFTRFSEKACTRHQYKLMPSDHLEVVVESSFDDGKTWLPVAQSLLSRGK